MLAEIYLLRLETLMRASEEATLAENFRFVPPNPVSERQEKALGATSLIERAFKHDRKTRGNSTASTSGRGESYV